MGKILEKLFIFCFLMSAGCLCYTQVLAAPTTLGPKIPVASGKDPDIAIDSKGALHLAYVRSSKTYYRKVFPPYTNKNFGKEHYIGSGSNPQIAIDSKDAPHIVYGKAKYSYWNGSKFVGAVQAFVGWRKNLIAIDSKDRVYIIADKYSPRAVLARTYVNGKPINNPVKVGNDNPGGVGVDSSDTLHITWRNGNTYYNTYSLAKGKGPTIRFSESSGDFSWCSVNPVTESIHAVYTAAYAKGMHYIAKRGGVWKNKLHFGRNEVYQHEPDDINPVSTNDAQGYTYITFRGAHERGYFVVIDTNDKIISGLKYLDPEDNTNPGRKMTNPNIISNGKIDGAYVAWGTNTVYVRSIGMLVENSVKNTLPIIFSKLLLSKKRVINIDLLPTVVTDPATNVEETKARLNGTINPSGSDTTAIFQWGARDSLPLLQTISVDGVYGGIDDKPLFVNLTGLEQGTEYVYRIIARNSEGGVDGDLQNFTTEISQSPTAVTAPATDVTETEATLNGTVNPNGLDTTVTFEWGPVGSLPNLTVVSVDGSFDGVNDVPLTLDLTELDKGTIYTYRITATNADGSRSGEYQNFTADILSAPTVSALDPLIVSSTNAILRGVVNPNGSETTVTFEAGLPGLTGSFDAEETPINGNSEQNVTYSATIPFALPGVSYTYRIIVNNGNGGDAEHNVYSQEITFSPGGSE